MSNLKNKKFIISVIGWSLVCFVLLFSFLFKNTNKLKGNVLESIPVNNNFKDIEFYGCALISYNEEHGTNYTLNHNLTDEELEDIHTLKCLPEKIVDYGIYSKFKELPEVTDDYFFNDYNSSYIKDKNEIFSENILLSRYENYREIKDLTGIEKMPNIETMDLLYGLSEIEADVFNKTDFSNNKKLKDIKITARGDVDFSNLSNNEEVNSLLIYSNSYNYGKTIHNINSLRNLKKLFVYTSNWDYSELGDLTNLTDLYFERGYLGGKDLSGLANLKKLETLSMPETSDQIIENINELSNLKKLFLRASSLDHLKKLNPKILENLTYLEMIKDYWWPREPLMEFPYMPNLNTLSLEGFDLSNIDFNNFENLEKLSIRAYDNETKLSDFKNYNVLQKLRIFNSNLLDLNGIEEFRNLKILYDGSSDYNKTKIEKQNTSVEKFYGDINNLQYFPNTKVFVETALNSEKEISEESKNIYSNLEEIFYSSARAENLMSDISFFPNLKTLVIGSFDSNNLAKIPNIENLYIDSFYDSSEEAIDLSSLSNIKNLVIKNFINNNKLSGIENLSNAQIIIIGDEFYTDKKEIDLSGLSNLKTIFINPRIKVSYDSADIPVVKFNRDENGLNNNIKSIFGGFILDDFSYLRGIENLAVAIKNYNEAIDLTNSKKLSNFILLPYYEEKLRYYNVVNKSKNKKSLDFKIKLPENFSYTCEFEEGEICREEEILNEVGVFSYNMNITNNSIAKEDYLYCGFDGTFIVPVTTAVFDFKSDLYDINSDYNYIFVGTGASEKKIISNFYQDNPFFKSEEVDIPLLSAYIDKGNLKTFVPKVVTSEIFSYKVFGPQFKIIGVNSKKYDIKDDYILYNGIFDVSNLKITNAVGKVEGNILKIIYNDHIVKEYELRQKNNLVGDVNGDGIISIADMILQYKHVKYIIDLEDDDLYRADLNSDSDVTTTDVSNLYKIIKNLDNGGGNNE